MVETETIMIIFTTAQLHDGLLHLTKLKSNVKYRKCLKKNLAEDFFKVTNLVAAQD
jgi:hypothetical protein